MNARSNIVGAFDASRLSEANLAPALEKFLGAHLNAHVSVGPLRRYSSGFSWMTFGFALSHPHAPTQELIVQVGPPTGLFAPYTARPLASCLVALEDSQVPVAKLVAWSDDPEILGAPFFVCHKVPGEAVEPWRLQSMQPSQRARLAENFIDILGHLHAPGAPIQSLASDAVGITPANAIDREIAHWANRLRKWSSTPHPLLTWAEHWLRSHAQPAPRLCIAHGDFRLGNFLYDDGRVSAVLDWEMVHIGHPFEDLGWLFSATFNKGSRRLFGELPRATALARYTAISGLKVHEHDLHYFECLALYKSIAITVAAKHSCERRGFNDMRMASMATQIAIMSRQLDRLIGERP